MDAFTLAKCVRDHQDSQAFSQANLARLLADLEATQHATQHPGQPLAPSRTTS